MEYSQNQGFFDDRRPGERLQTLLGREGADVGQADRRLMGDGKPGQRILNTLQEARGRGSEASQSSMDSLMPDNPGPALTGRTPLVGSMRRSNDLPVARDEFSSMMG